MPVSLGYGAMHGLCTGQAQGWREEARTQQLASCPSASCPAPPTLLLIRASLADKQRVHSGVLSRGWLRVERPSQGVPELLRCMPRDGFQGYRHVDIMWIPGLQACGYHVDSRATGMWISCGYHVDSRATGIVWGCSAQEHGSSGACGGFPGSPGRGP